MTGIKPYQWTTKRIVDLGKGQVTHSFLIVPECPYPLLGRDLLKKMKAQIHFSNDEARVLNIGGQALHILMTSNLSEEYRLHQRPLSPDPGLEKWLQDYPNGLG